MDRNRPSLKRPASPYPRPDPHQVRIWSAGEIREMAQHAKDTTEWICNALEYLLARDADINGCPGCGMLGEDFCVCDRPSVHAGQDRNCSCEGGKENA